LGFANQQVERSDGVDGMDWGSGMAKELPVAEVGNLSEKMMLH